MVNQTLKLVERSQMMAKWKDYVDSSKVARKAIDFYNNNQKSYMLDHWRKKLDMDEFNLIRDNIAYYPITKQVIDEISKMYQNGISVKAYKGGKVDDDIVDDINNMIDESGMTSILRYVNQMVELTGSCAVIPYTMDGLLKFYVLTKDNFIVDQNPYNPSVVDAFYYSIGSKGESSLSSSRIDKYYKITNEYTQEVSINSVNGLVKEESPRVVNKLGKINAVIFSNDVSGTCLIGDYTNPIVDMNIDINAIITKLNVLVEMQSFSTLVVTGSTPIDGFKYGETRYLQLFANEDSMGNQLSPNASFISPSAKLKELDEIIENKMIRCANSFGIGASAFKNDASSFSSGYQLRLAKEDVLNSIAQKRPIYERQTQNLINMSISIYNTANQHDMIVGFDKLTIDIREPTYDISFDERVNTIGRKIELGLVSKVQAIMELNGVNREEALALYKEMIEDNFIPDCEVE